MPYKIGQYLLGTIPSGKLKLFTILPVDTSFTHSYMILAVVMAISAATIVLFHHLRQPVVLG